MSRLSIRWKFFWAVLAPLLLVLSLIALFTHRWMLDQARENFRVAAVQDAVQAAGLIDAQYQAVAQVARDTAAYLSLGRPAGAQGLERLVRASLRLQPLLHGALIALNPGLAGASGGLRAPYAFRDAEEVRVLDLAAGGYDYTASGHDWYRLPGETGLGVWSGPLIEEGGSGQALARYSVPLLADERFLGVAAVDVALADIQRHAPLAARRHRFVILDAGGAFMSHPTPDLVMHASLGSLSRDKGWPELARLNARIKDGGPGILRLERFGTGEPHWIAYAPMSVAGWIYAAAIPEAEAMAAASGQFRRVGFLFGAMLLLLPLVVYLVSGLFTRPLRRLAAGVREMGLAPAAESAGNAGAGLDEVSVLAKAIGGLGRQLDAGALRLGEVERERERHRRAVAEVKREFSQHEQQCARVRNELAHRERTCARLREEMSRRDAECLRLQEEFGRQREAFTQLGAEYAQQEAARNELGSEMARREKAFARLQEQFTQQQEACDELQREYARQEVAREELSSELARREQACDRLSEALAAREAVCERMGEDFEQREKAFERVRQQCNHQQAAYRALLEQHSARARLLEQEAAAGEQLKDRLASLARTQAALSRLRRRQHLIRNGFEICGTYADGQGPARSWFDVVSQTDQETLLVVAQVRGAGPAAAALSGLLPHMIREAAHAGMSPGEIAGDLDDRLADSLAGQVTVALWLARCDTWTGAYSYLAAGLSPAFLMDAHGAVAPLAGPAAGPALGGTAGAAWSQQSASLGAGETLVLHTPGLFDPGAGDAPGCSAQEAALLLITHAAADLDKLCDLLLEAVDGECGGQREGDEALLMVRNRWFDIVHEQAPVTVADKAGTAARTGLGRLTGLLRKGGR